LRLLEAAIESFDWSSCKAPGQAKIPMSTEACQHVYSGIGLKTENPNDYVIRQWRGSVAMYLKREHAIACDSVKVIVYTKQAYLDDPDCKGNPEKGIIGDEEEYNRVSQSDCTHVLIAVQADAGPESPVAPGRFVANLAGANNEYEAKTAEQLQQLAREIRDYYATYMVVAD